MESEKICELPESDRPREKLARRGPASLTDAELLAIFIRTGTRGRNAIVVAGDLLAARGSLPGVARCSIQEIKESAGGIGPAKAAQLAAVFEVGKRLANGGMERPKLDNPQAIYELLAPEYQTARRETVYALLLDTRLRLLHKERISEGSLNESICHPREILRPAIAFSAYALILAHNHPSGDPAPSETDRRFTIRLAEATRLLQIEFADHVIIGTREGGRRPYFSFKENGML